MLHVQVQVQVNKNKNEIAAAVLVGRDAFKRIGSAHGQRLGEDNRPR